MSPLSHVALVTVCTTASLLVHVTGCPTVALVDDGAKANLAIDTLAAAGAGALVAPDCDVPAVGSPRGAPGWTTILRGALPTGTVARTERDARSTIDTSLD